MKLFYLLSFLFAIYLLFTGLFIYGYLIIGLIIFDIIITVMNNKVENEIREILISMRNKEEQTKKLLKYSTKT
jgi:multisubunit Na+/H+ antiporter MnhE subunit